MNVSELFDALQKSTLCAYQSTEIASLIENAPSLYPSSVQPNLSDIQNIRDIPKENQINFVIVTNYFQNFKKRP